MHRSASSVFFRLHVPLLPGNLRTNFGVAILIFLSEFCHLRATNRTRFPRLVLNDTRILVGTSEFLWYRCRFTPVLLCNVLPNVTDTSHGAWRRLVSVQFPTLFKEQPDPKKPNERPVDFAIDGKIESWADVFLTYMLTRGYEAAKQTGLNVPESVVLTTDDYRTESDFYSDYFKERLVLTTVESDTLTWTHLWNDFYHWFRKGHGQEHIPKKVECRKRFEEMIGRKLKHGEWTGVMIPYHCSRGP